MSRTWFRNLSVKWKIVLVAGVFSAFLVTMLVMVVLDGRAAQQRTEAMYRNNLLATGDLMQVRTSFTRAMVLVNNVLSAPTPEAAARAEADMDKMDESFDAAWERYQKSWSSDLARRLGPGYHDAAMEQRRRGEQMANDGVLGDPQSVIENKGTGKTVVICRQTGQQEHRRDEAGNGFGA